MPDICTCSEQVFPYGLAEEEQACQIVSDNINVADGHVICTQEQLAAYNGQMMSRGTVHTVRMDTFVSGAHFDVLKLDVEGYEPHVLAGAGTSRLLLAAPVCCVVFATDCSSDCLT